VKVIGIRFCAVSPEAQELADFLGNGLGLPQMAQGGAGADTDTFRGAVFPAGESWIEVWPEGP
jgi:hypothetical protein